MKKRLADLAVLLENAFADDAPADILQGGLIRDGYDAEVDAYRRLTQHGKEYLAQLQNAEIQKTGITALKIKSNNVFGYFFEVPKGQAKNVPEYFTRKQTLTNAERFITPELKGYEEKVFSAEAKLLAREQELFARIREQTLQYTTAIQSAAEAIAELDLIFSFARTAQKRRYAKPRFSKKQELRIAKGRHPVVEVLGENYNRERFVPNDLELDAHKTFALVTGPNMAGKSTFLRQNALILLLAHLGSFVPAQSATVPLVDSIFTRIGSGDILSKGQSTFLVEMQEASHILRNATENSFIILDEIGRGTSTFDGLSLAWAITEFLEKQGIKTLFATHYHELIAVTENLPKGQNLSVAVLENETGVTFLHQIVAGGASKSFGIEVAELAGVPAGITKRAQEVLQQLEASSGNPPRSPFAKGEEDQPNLFSLPLAEKKELSEMEKELKNLDIENMTPLEALQKVWEWRRKNEEK